MTCAHPEGPVLNCLVTLVELVNLNRRQDVLVEQHGSQHRTRSTVQVLEIPIITGMVISFSVGGH